MPDIHAVSGSSALTQIRGSGLRIPEGQARIWRYRPQPKRWDMVKAWPKPMPLATARKLRGDGLLLEWVPVSGAPVICAPSAELLDKWNGRSQS